MTMPKAVHQFRPTCPGCTAEALVRSGGRPCSSYDCPGLPKALQVTCDRCMYDFAADDGQVLCDHQTCEEAKRLHSNVPNYRAWIELLSAEAVD